jgi:hypothetical protein
MQEPTLLNDPVVLARLEMRALEKMARVLCEHSRQLLATARARGALGTREAGFQVEAFAERCAQVGALLDVVDAPVSESRISRLEQLVAALECSRSYFRGLLQDPVLRRA